MGKELKDSTGKTTPLETSPVDGMWAEDPFEFIRPESYSALGIDPGDIPSGTFPAKKHPSQIESRFGGNAYGFGLFELSHRLGPQDLALLQSLSEDDPEYIRKNHRELNRIYRSLGLLIRFSSQGRPYYLVPEHLISSSMGHIRNKTEEISNVINFHRKKYFVERQSIGLITHSDDLLINSLSVRFKEHQFFVIDSLEKLKSIAVPLDLVVITRDIQEILVMEKFPGNAAGPFSRPRMERFARYLMSRIYRALKPEGEIFIIANHYPLRTNQTIKVNFKSGHEKKKFLIFSHIFKTRKRYSPKSGSERIHEFDLQKFLRGVYVEKEVLDRLLGGRDLGDISFREIAALPYLNYSMDPEAGYDQERVWPEILSDFFDEISFKTLVPASLKAEWRRRFSTDGYTPRYKITYLGQKKPMDLSLQAVQTELDRSQLAGCPLPLLAEYRNSFEYVNQTLKVLVEIKNRTYEDFPELFMARLRQPFENKARRYSGFNDVVKLLKKIKNLERIQTWLNPDAIEGPRTPVIENIGILPFFGFSKGEIREIYLIVVGHTAMGRVLSGKMSEKSLRPLSDLARTLELSKGLNLLRYCRLMTMAETVASKGTALRSEHLAELFDLYASVVRVVTNRDMDWDRLLDEKTSEMGGIHNMVVRKSLKIMDLVDHFEFLDNWEELRLKGEMEKESLADYDPLKVHKIENIIRLIQTIEEFENRFLRDDPLKLPIFYRKFLNLEFHGTGHIFEQMDSRLAFILLWIGVNVVQGDILNFNPLLGDSSLSEVEDRAKRIEDEAGAINIDYLDLETLEKFGEQIYKNETGFVMGTGIQFRVDRDTQALDCTCIDLDETIFRLDQLTKTFTAQPLSEIVPDTLAMIDKLFSKLEAFYQNYPVLVGIDGEVSPEVKPPLRQTVWLRRVSALRKHLRNTLQQELFKPEALHEDLSSLYRHARSLFWFVFPQLRGLENLDLTGFAYLKSSPIDYIFRNIRKVQALAREEHREFQDTRALHKLAQREFGPMTAGTVGVSESQIEKLQEIMRQLRGNPALFDALLKSFVFQDLGRVPSLRERYAQDLHPVDHAIAGAVLLEKEHIPHAFNMDEAARKYLGTLIRYHDFMYHIQRGEFGFESIREVIAFKDREFLDAFFINAFLMISSLREELILEDLAGELFQIRALVQRVMDGRMSLDAHLEGIYEKNGLLFNALESYMTHGLPENANPIAYLEEWQGGEDNREANREAGKKISSLERMFRLRGIMYVRFPDLAKLLVKVPMRFIYKKRDLFGIGYPTFERELYEAFRTYRSLQKLPKEQRDFIFDRLIGDKVRLYGYENVSWYLSYENQIKLLLIALLGSLRLAEDPGKTLCISFLSLMVKVGRRYEALNDYLTGVSADELWGDPRTMDRFLKESHGIVLELNPEVGTLTVDFVDKYEIGKKIVYMKSITNLDQLKNYFHYSLQSLRKTSFYTDDYELGLERAFDQRLEEITDLMLDQTKKQMELHSDFLELHNIYTDLMDRGLEIGFTSDQMSKLRDFYELRKDDLKRQKLREIDQLLESMQDPREVRDYWESIKWYLHKNRKFLGKEFENMIARNFDRAMEAIKE